MNPASPPEIYASDRAAWRRWLEANADAGYGIWLVYDKGPDRDLTYESVVEEALCFGWIDSKGRRKSDTQTMLYLAPRNSKSSWSRSNKDRVERLITADLIRPRGLALIQTAKANGAWTALDQVDLLIEPDDLGAALNASADARRHWDAFSPSARRAILEWISTAKRAETRARRIRLAVEEAGENRRANQQP